MTFAHQVSIIISKYQTQKLPLIISGMGGGEKPRAEVNSFAAKIFQSEFDLALFQVGCWVLGWNPNDKDNLWLRSFNRCTPRGKIENVGSYEQQLRLALILKVFA